MRAGPKVDVVGAQRQSGELRVRVGVGVGEPATGQHPDPAVVPGFEEAAGRDRHGLGPGRRLQHPVRVPHQGPGNPVTLADIREREASLVAIPFLVDLRVSPSEPPGDGAGAVVGPQRAAASAVLAHRVRGDQVERPGPEPVGGGGQRSDRADLDGVPREVRLERRRGVDPDLLRGTAFQQVDELVAGDLVGEPGATLAQHAAFSVQQDLGGDVDRLDEDPLRVPQPGVR